MRRLMILAASAALMLAAGCSQSVPQQAEYARGCTEAATGNRVADEYCPYDDDDDHDGFYPMYFPVGFHVPAVGHKMSGGHRKRPAGKVIIVVVPRDGGTKRAQQSVPLRRSTVVKPPAAKPPVAVPARPARPGTPIRVRSRR